MRKDDVTRIKHILDAGREIIAFKEGFSKDDMQKDRLRMLALVKEIEIIGEAASKISEDRKNQLPLNKWAGGIRLKLR